VFVVEFDHGHYEEILTCTYSLITSTWCVSKSIIIKMIQFKNIIIASLYDVGCPVSSVMLCDAL